MDEVAAVEAARWLDSAGVLSDSDSRPGLPLRNLLRAGAIAGADQRPPTKHGRWFIVRVERLKPAAAQLQPPTPGHGGRAGQPASRAGRQMRGQRMPRTPEPENAGAVLEPTDLAHALRQAPRTVVAARRTPQAGGLPARGGIYAWWMAPGAIPAAPAHRTPRHGSSCSTLASRQEVLTRQPPCALEFLVSTWAATSARAPFASRLPRSCSRSTAGPRGSLEAGANSFPRTTEH